MKGVNRSLGCVKIPSDKWCRKEGRELHCSTHREMEAECECEGAGVGTSWNTQDGAGRRKEAITRRP